MNPITPDLIYKTLGYVLASVVQNTNKLPELDIEDKETVLNTVFNVLVNTLQPEYADMFVRLLTDSTQAVREIDIKETLTEITEAMKSQER